MTLADLLTIDGKVALLIVVRGFVELVTVLWDREFDLIGKIDIFEWKLVFFRRWRLCFFFIALLRGASGRQTGSLDWRGLLTYKDCCPFHGCICGLLSSQKDLGERAGLSLLVDHLCHLLCRPVKSLG